VSRPSAWSHGGGESFDQHAEREQLAAEMTEELHIASVIVRSRPERLADLKRVIAAVPGAEIPAEDGAGRLIVTLEAPSEAVLARQLEAFAAMPGVLAATLVVHHAEPAEAEEGASP
jgi:nitrate reductase NapD